MSNEDKTTFIHTVFFWLKDGITEAEKSEFAKGIESLATIDTIAKFHYGPPAMTPRDVVDNSYAFALNLHFKTKAAHDSYQNDPVHHQFIEDYQHLWQRVQVYDNIVREL